MLIWTIHDFPGYGTVGGFVHQGFAVCPWRGEELGGEHSTKLTKQTYGGCRRWLLLSHILKSEGLKDHFNGRMETRDKLARLLVEAQIRHGKEYATWKVAGNQDSAAGNPSKSHGVKRINILSTLPYWKVRIIFNANVKFFEFPAL
jgi:hypothetical protein